MTGGTTSFGTGSAGEFGGILDALRARVAVMGLRAVAREVGMSPSGLRKVLDGGGPFGPTREKLRTWHQRHLAGDYRTAQDVAMETLLRDVPRDHRARVEEQIRALLRGEDPCA